MLVVMRLWELLLFITGPESLRLNCSGFSPLRQLDYSGLTGLWNVGDSVEVVVVCLLVGELLLEFVTLLHLSQIGILHIEFLHFLLGFLFGDLGEVLECCASSILGLSETRHYLAPCTQKVAFFDS